MNIIVSPYREEYFSFRSDSSLIRKISHYFIPDYVKGVSIAPIFYVKVSRPCKAVAERFVERHIEEGGFGLFLYPDLIDTIGDNRVFVSNSLDYTSIVPLKSENLLILLNEKEVFPPLLPPSKEEINSKISLISNYYSLKIGDFVAFETAPKVECKSGDRIELKNSGLPLFEFDII